MIIAKQILELNKVIYWEGEVNFWSLKDELWDVTICFCTRPLGLPQEDMQG
jgi:hypothetical protein